MVVYSRLVPSFVCTVCSRRGDAKGISYHVYLALQRFERGVLPMHVRSSPKAAMVPVHLLRSGWDHELDLHSPIGSFHSKHFSVFKKAPSTRTSTPSPPPPEDNEAVFAQSTHNYLTSSTAQQLRLPLPPPTTRPQNHAPPAFHLKQSLVGTPATPTTIDVDPIISASPSSFVFPVDAWQKLPPTIPSSVSPLDSGGIADSPRSSSPLSTRSSLGSTIIDALGAIPAHFRDSPFNVNGPGVTMVPVAQGPRGLTQHRLSTRTGSRKNEMIYMTVVHETVTGP
ncbi:hypothetical protein BJV74DRAFT_540818 [Russula compacta]|nr:hypothetical protein BJV74DRAFT_540818 [Russula compacta]